MIIYATSKLKNGRWHAACIFQDPTLAVYAMMKHSHGRPWILSDHQDTIQDIIHQTRHPTGPSSHKKGSTVPGRSGFPRAE